MNIPIKQVLDILSNQVELEPINFHLNFIPEDNRLLEKLPMGRLVEIDTTYTDYASNDPLSLEFCVQVDLWFSSLQEANEYYFLIDELMRENEWQCVYSELTTDTDLENCNRIIKRYYTTQRIEIN
ncbi:hypothetical protein [Enterococcus faecalis]|uniref:hypothetical protein n=1 Tax=Enterococcus faecalis TaxID=1351 RepID=UPI00406A3491